MRIPKPRRRWVVVAVVLLLVIAAVRVQNRAMPVYYYRVVDQQTLVIGTITGAGAWTRVTGVTETPSIVTITASALLAPLPSTGGGYGLEFVLKLREPIAGRTVVDGSSGLTVQRTRCLPPAYFAPGCV